MQDRGFTRACVRMPACWSWRPYWKARQDHNAQHQGQPLSAAGSARARGMGNADGGHGAASARNSRRALLTGCMNLLYHRHTENVSNRWRRVWRGSRSAVGIGRDWYDDGTGKSNGLSGMNVIRGHTAQPDGSRPRRAEDTPRRRHSSREHDRFRARASTQCL